ncbi:inhibitor of nuclear factor kappa-B kinase subunit alpha-like [Oculina patagonica]
MECARERKRSREGWVEERCLGSGAFGTVLLYENKITKEQIALKRCRMELNPHNKKLWHQEVDIMKRLDHPNLVSAKEVPPPLDVSDDELPLLAMEFCSGGDLRKVLNAPESCCGLKEKTVLKITSDVAAAVEFLHGHRIIHRDLKPENIVISHADNKVVYKLIDLGYAKELDQGSLATTFVGTFKYLAPELLDKVKYTKTVDYWSFGTVLFECITGMRPFLTELSPVQWYNKVRDKGPDDICAYFDLKEDIRFSSVLPTPNSLCRQLQDKFVALLRLLLLWDPKARGGSVLRSGKKECFDVLEKIINTVIVRVFAISSAVVLPFEVLPTETIEDLQVKICDATGVDVREQELLTASGQAVKPKTLVVDCIKDNKTGEDCALFLLPTNNEPTSTRPFYTMPPTVQGMVTEQKTLMSYEELKRALAQGVNFCREQIKLNQLLIEGFRAAQISLLVLNSTLGQLKADVMTEFNKLEAKIDFFNSSLQTDLEIYADNINIVKNDKLLRSWKRAQKKVESFQNNDVPQLKDLTTALQGRVVELQKSPYASGTQSKSKMDEMRYQCAVQLYEKLRQSDRRPADCQQMATIILQILAQREKLHKDIFTQLSEVMTCRREMRRVMHRLLQVKAKLVSRAEELSELQKQRQVDLWRLLQSKKRNEQDCHCSSSSSHASLSSLATSSVSTQSVVLIEESSRNFERFAGMLNQLKIDQISDTENFDWEFLEEHDLADKVSV